MRSRSALLCALMATAIGVSACGGSSSSSSVASVLAPSATATLAGVTLTVVTPGIGATVNAAGVANLSTGTGVPITSGYTSDTPSVATVTDAGAVTGVAIGDATITVQYQGMKASQKIHVLPNYAGTFWGTFVINKCVDSLGFTDSAFCASFADSGAWDIGFLNAQSPDLTQTAGYFALGGLQGSSTGAVDAAGTLALSGGFSFYDSMFGGTTTVTTMAFQNFAITSPAPGRLAGTFQAVFSNSMATGGATWTCTMADATRTAAALRSSVRATLTPRGRLFPTLIGPTARR